MFKLEGKVALVTGGSRGIGRACSIALARQGATVLINYVKGKEAATQACEEIQAFGGKAEPICFDVANTKGMETSIESAVKQHGQLDILLCSAGISIDGLLLRLNDDMLDELWRVNVRGSIQAARIAVRSMLRKRSGRILFLSSVVGESGNVGQTAYSATKSALFGAMKSIAKEVASRGITVNAVAPGFIDTDMTMGMTDVMRAKLLEMIPLGRIGQVSEVASACVYLASNEASYITGQILSVNGGLYM